MILPMSTASHLYWLGRYWVRVEGLCQVVPFFNDDAARAFAHAFSLPAWNAETMNALINDPEQSGSLPSNLEAIKQNIQSLRGVLTAATFEAFHELSRGYLHRTVDETLLLLHHCRSAFIEETPMVQRFCRMGEAIERIDIALRLAESPAGEIQALGGILDSLPIGWQRLKEPIVHLNQRYDRVSFYDLSDRVHELFRNGL